MLTQSLHLMTLKLNLLTSGIMGKHTKETHCELGNPLNTCFHYMFGIALK